MTKMAFVLFLFILFFSLSTCVFFDPLFGLYYPTYGSTFSRSFAGNPVIIRADCPESYSTVTIDGNDVYLSYGFQGSLYFARSKDAGHTWEQTALTDNATYNISMATKNGVTAIACNSGGDIRCFRTADGGTTFTHVTVDTDATFTGDCYTGVACDGKLVFVSYPKNGSDGYSDMRLGISTDRGQTFTIRAVDDDSTDQQMASSVAYDSERHVVYACYQKATSGSPSENLSIVSYSGENFDQKSGPYIVPGSTDDDTWGNSITVNDTGNIVLVYRGASSGPRVKSATPINFTTNTWSTTNADSVGDQDPYIISIPGHYYVSYYVGSGSIKFASATSPGGSWSASTVDSQSSGGSVSGRKCSIAVSSDTNTMFFSYVDYSADQINDPPDLVLAKWTNTGGWNSD
jgi:hypothetical protein